MNNLDVKINREEERLKRLAEFGILDTPPEQEYDTIVALAAYICNAPLAAIVFIDEERAWVKASVGGAISNVPREHAICNFALECRDYLVVPDTSKDSRFRENRFVVGAPFLRFYAGVPLLTDDRYCVGVLCVGDHVPRVLRTAQLGSLMGLSKLVISQLDLRRHLHRELQHIREPSLAPAS
jgi:two-component system, cell cycle sensor histidine kinase and response regulator CckA